MSKYQSKLIFSLFTLTLNISYGDQLLNNGNKAIRNVDKLSSRSYVMDPLNRYVWLLPPKNQVPLDWSNATSQCENLNRAPETPLGLKKWKLPSGHILGYNAPWYSEDDLIFNIAFQNFNSSSYNQNYNYALVEAIPELKSKAWWTSTGGMFHKRVFMRQYFETTTKNGSIEIGNKIDHSKEKPAIADSSRTHLHNYICVSEY